MKKVFIPVILIVFAVLSAVFLYMKSALPEYHFNVLMIANGLLALLSIASYLLVSTQISKKPEAFVRGVYSASLLKLLVCMFAALTYILLNKHHIHKPTLFTLFGIYVVYSATENILLSKMARTK